MTPKHDLNQPDMAAATARVLAACKARGKVATVMIYRVTDAAAQVAMIMVPNQEMARRKLAEGWDGVFPGADITWIINAAKQFVDIV